MLKSKSVLLARSFRKYSNKGVSYAKQLNNQLSIIPQLNTWTLHKSKISQAFSKGNRRTSRFIYKGKVTISEKVIKRISFRKITIRTCRFNQHFKPRQQRSWWKSQEPIFSSETNDFLILMFYCVINFIFIFISFILYTFLICSNVLERIKLLYLLNIVLLLYIFGGFCYKYIL